MFVEGAYGMDLYVHSSFFNWYRSRYFTETLQSIRGICGEENARLPHQQMLFVVRSIRRLSVVSVRTVSVVAVGV